MFRKIINSMETANAKAAFKRGEATCPECGAPPPRMPGKWDGVLACPGCGAKASVFEWAAASAAGGGKGHADSRPDGTAIRREETAGGVTWNIPAKGKFGFLMVFAVLWLAITALVSGGFLVTYLTGGEIEGDMPEWVLIPFFGIFWAVGLGVLYAGLREKFMCHSVSVSDGKVTLIRRMFGRENAKSIAAGKGTSVSQKEFYQQNYKPVYGIEIRNESGKLRFGSTLSEEEKAWLVADIGRSVAGSGRQAALRDGASADGLLKIKLARPKEVFSITLPPPGKSAMIVSLVLAAMGIAFFCIGLFVMEGNELPRDQSEGAGYWFVMVFALFENGFRAIWLLISGFFALTGIGIFVATVRKVGLDQRIEGSRAAIAIRTYKRGFMTDEKSFPRDQVADIRASESGHDNGTPMKRIELIVGDRAERIADWLDGEKAEAIISEVREALGVRR